MLHRIQIVFGVLVTLVISGCVTQPLATDGSAKVGPDEGLMAVRFISDYEGNESALYENLSYSVGLLDAKIYEMLEMRSNDDAQLIALPAGEYRWAQAGVGRYYFIFEPGATFTIRPGEITYVGDITLLLTPERFILIANELQVEDPRGEPMARLRNDYGDLVDKYPVTVEIPDLAIQAR
jgi:hypothetical protein